MLDTLIILSVMCVASIAFLIFLHTKKGREWFEKHC